MTSWKDDQAYLCELVAAGLGAEECAQALGRSKDAVYSYAAKIKLRFNSRACREVREHVRRGAFLVRDEVGGAVGVHWACATRSGGAFLTPICEKLVELGILRPITPDARVYGGGAQ